MAGVLAPGFWGAVLSLFAIDLVLSGDNAIVIALAVRRLPPAPARRAAIAGALVAVGLRVLFAALASVLLALAYVRALGGLLLFWVAFDLLAADRSGDRAPTEAASVDEAVKRIVLADLVMSLDNILAVGGAAHGDVGLLAIGLGLSIPCVLFGATLLARTMSRWPLTIYAGAAVVAWTAGGMVLQDPLAARLGPGWGPPLVLSAALAVLVVGWRARARRDGSR